MSTSNSVVLPAPLWPIRPTIVAGWIMRWTSSSARMPPKRLVTPRASRVMPRVGRSHGGGTRLRGGRDAAARARAAPMNTARRMSGRSSRPAVGPRNRTWPFSRNTRPVAQQQGDVDRLLDHDDRRAVARGSRAPCRPAGRRRSGARPSDSSSMHSSLGRVTNAMASESCCCSPPDRSPASWSCRSPRIGNMAIVSAAQRLGGVRVVAQHPARQPQVLGHRQGGEHALAARHERQAQAGDLLGRQAGDVAPVEGDRPPAGGSRPADRLEHGRLAGTVGAEQGQHLVALDAHVDAEQHLQRAVGRLDALAGQQVGAEPLAPDAAHHQAGARRVAVDRPAWPGSTASSTVSTSSCSIEAVAAGHHPHEPVAAPARTPGRVRPG